MWIGKVRGHLDLLAAYAPKQTSILLYMPEICVFWGCINIHHLQSRKLIVSQTGLQCDPWNLPKNIQTKSPTDPTTDDPFPGSTTNGTPNLTTFDQDEGIDLGFYFWISYVYIYICKYKSICIYIQTLLYIYHYIPTCELIHPLPKVLVKMNFLCPRCDRWYLIYNLKSVVCFEMCWIFVVSFWRGVLFKSFRGVLKLCVPMIPILPLHSIICRHTSLHVRYLPFPLWLHPFEV